MHSNCSIQLQDTQFTTRTYGSGLTFFLALTFCIIKSYEGHYQVYNSILPKAIIYRWAFFSFSNYYYFSSLLKAKYQICTQGGGVDCIRLVLRLNFDFHQSKDVCFVVVVVVCRKAASLFRGTFCYMMLTDIPLCI